APRGIFHQPVNHVPPELAEVAVVPLAPESLEIDAPAGGGIGKHREGAAAPEGFARKDRHDAGTANWPVAEAERGCGRFEPVALVGAVELRHLREDLPIADRFIHDITGGHVWQG